MFYELFFIYGSYGWRRLNCYRCVSSAMGQDNKKLSHGRCWDIGRLKRALLTKARTCSSLVVNGWWSLDTLKRKSRRSFGKSDAVREAAKSVIFPAEKYSGSIEKRCKSMYCDTQSCWVRLIQAIWHTFSKDGRCLLLASKKSRDIDLLFSITCRTVY